MKIYTRAGDKGMTSLIGGRQVPKNHERIEAYGAVDELIAFIGLLRDSCEGSHKKEFLLGIQDHLMAVASLLASEDKEIKGTLPAIREQDVIDLEMEIDRMNDVLPPLHSFIVPGGHTLVSICHIARTICRRAERNIIKIAVNHDSDQFIIPYLNRLSDFLFVLSRLISKELDVKEVPWKPLL